MMCTAAKRLLSALGLALTASLASTLVASGEDNPYAPQPQASLKQMLSIDWKRGPDLPQGIQDPGCGILNGTLVMASGFCGGQNDVPGKAGKYPRGFVQKSWGLNLQSPQSGWQCLPDFPLTGRQGGVSDGITVDNQLYYWGGVNYDAPYTYAVGCRLTNHRNQWSWDTAVPPLLSPVCYGGGVSIGSKVYVFGGADYGRKDPNDANSLDFFTNTDHTGKVRRLGARLMMIDTQNLSAGCTQLASCPGTPRWVAAVAAVGWKIYVFSGQSGVDNASKTYCNVVDNWQYDPGTDSWTRLQDMPVASGGFPAGKIVAFDRYILMVGGGQYDHVLGQDGSVRPVYGTVAKHDPGYAYFSDVFVYDTQRGKFGTATPLPLNDGPFMALVDGDQIRMIGGEVAGASGFSGTWIGGAAYGHHPDLYLTGTVRVLTPEPGTLTPKGPETQPAVRPSGP
jgi:N-acetylneuraminic acid mutarotase